MEPGGTSRYAFGKRQKEYLSWLRTYRGVEFEGHYANQTVVFCYRKAEKLLSERSVGCSGAADRHKIHELQRYSREGRL